MIVSSPFIRCVQTSIIAAKNKNINEIFIDFRLAEFNDSFIFINPFETDKIYETTKDFLKDSDVKLTVLNDSYKGGKPESEQEYFDRIKTSLKDLINIPKNILVVTHGHSLSWKGPNLSYGEKYYVTGTELQSGGSISDYYSKYLYYKSLYISLKNKQIL